MISKLKTLAILMALASGIAVFSAPVLAAASSTPISSVNPKNCLDGKTKTITVTGSNGQTNTEVVCADIGNNCINQTVDSGCYKQTPLVKDLQNIVNALAIGVGVLVLGSIIAGGIQYIVAGDQPSGVEQAKKRITNGLFALVAFILSYAFLQWLIPGGIFK